jgi:hypothetical protein
VQSDDTLAIKAETTAAVGREVVAALDAAGLST